MKHYTTLVPAPGGCWWLGGGTTRHQAAGSQQLAPVLSRPWRNAVSSRAEHVRLGFIHRQLNMIILATGGEQAAIKEVIQVRGSVAGQLGVQGSLLLSLQDLTTAIMI